MPSFYNAEEFVFSLLHIKLPSQLLYHGPDHTKDVLKAAERLAIMEGVHGNDLLVLKTGALYHDAGYVVRYHHNEPEGVALAQRTLPSFGYTEKQMDIISRMILATQLPQSPKTILEEIMCDADLDNLGREDFYEKAELLRRELVFYGVPKSPRVWYEELLPFLEQHRYFTHAARQLRQELKELHIREIKELLGLLQENPK